MSRNEVNTHSGLSYNSSRPPSPPPPLVPSAVSISSGSAMLCDKITLRSQFQNQIYFPARQRRRGPQNVRRDRPQNNIIMSHTARDQ